MSKRLSIVLGVVAAVVLGAAVAFAQTSPPHDTTLHGEGFASGSGTVAVEMSGVFRLAADGDVIVADRTGDARVHIGSHGSRTEGAGELAGESIYELTGFRGAGRVVGSDFTVEIDGFAAFRAHGAGTATLIGDGVWKTRHRRGFWSEDGEALGHGG